MVLEGPEHAAVVVRLSRTPNPVRVYVRYVWQPPYEVEWLMGEYRPDHHIDRALPGEYSIRISLTTKERREHPHKPAGVPA